MQDLPGRSAAGSAQRPFPPRWGAVFVQKGVYTAAAPCYNAERRPDAACARPERNTSARRQSAGRAAPCLPPAGRKERRILYADQSYPRRPGEIF